MDTVPQAPTPVPAPQNNSQNYAGAAMSSISQILEKNSQELNKAALAASTPVAGSGQGAIPSSLQGHQRTPQLGQLDERPVVGAGNARGRDIGNSIVAVSNLVNKVSAAHENKKSLEIADATQQLMELQQGISQAKLVTPESGAEAYAEAQKVIQSNTQRQSQLLSDNTIRKAIQKGMKIDFTDPKQNQTPEHKGVLLGRHKAEEAAKQKTLQQDPNFYAKKFQENQPQSMVPNMPAIEKYKMLAAQQKNLVDMQKALAPVLSATIRAGATIKAKEIGELAGNARKQAELTNRWQIAQAKIDAAKSMVKMKFGMTLSMQRQHMADTLKMQEELFDYKSGSQFTLQKNYSAMITKADSTIRETSDNLNKLLAGRDAAAKAKSDPNELNDYNNMIQMQKDTLAAAVAAKAHMKDVYTTASKMMNLGGSADAGEPESDSSGGGSGQGDTNVDPNSIQFWQSDEAEKLVNSSQESEGSTPE